MKLARSSPTEGLPARLYDPGALTEAYRERRFDDISRIFLDALAHFRLQKFGALGREAQYAIDMFVKHFLHLFTQEDYVPSDPDMSRFIELNPVISNLVAVSSFRTTDAFVEILSKQQRNFTKLLVLYSARNTVRLERKALFDTDPGLAARWYYLFFGNFESCCANENALQHLREHLRFGDERMTGDLDGAYVCGAYFGSTYIDADNDHLLKRRINGFFRRWGPTSVSIENRADKRKIAVITSAWSPDHVVYRCTQSFVKALAQDFELTLVHLGKGRDLDASLFKEVRQFGMGNPIDLSMLTPNDWAVAYFPDVGMNIESIYLSNLRIAPIQISGYGHPVSTFGSRIDYWLGGADVESRDDWERNYSERLVLVPGAGVASNKPKYAPREAFVPGETLFINCPWTCHKINFPMLERLKRILVRSKRAIRYRIFTAGITVPNGFLPLKRDISQVLGTGNVDVHTGIPYAEYMASMEQGAFNLDSYPFGGFATATDALHLGKPIVTWEGTKFFNRSAASLLRRVGLEELIVRDGEAYEELALRLIHDDRYRERVSAKLAKSDLDRAIFDHDDAKNVVKAFHYLIENHAILQKDERRQPIVVEA